ncbi:corticotropin-releasing factor receptor 2 [Nephila pilipes]|uniref:Corticotropin-releasing factor receptor 2 n=1 Tax=Nephila pilipes TaxID=299642 RepID=A0A8X6Q787_NEPPI|nr:corticotropin-releasing factor receptor 2 [Nephila pilipes]
MKRVVVPKEYEINKNEPYCEPVFDSVLCWPAIPANETAWRSCWYVLQYIPSLDVKSIVLPPGAKAYRICDKDGKWLWGNWTNYSECLNFTTTDAPKTPLTVSLILLICSMISLFFLSVTIFIFFYFKITGSLSWLCKTVVSVKMYAALSSINWMFVEGMLLHSRITTNIFQKDAPFKLYYLIGWGIPLILILSWCFTMSTQLKGDCWEGYGRSPYVWIITGPMIGALGVNLIFLVNIVRILVTKMKTSSTFEIIQIRRAMKATALLFPLLGITHLLFCVNPRDDSKLEEAYMITNATLQSSQGIFVSILYCFMNVEVQTVVRKAYVRAALRRNPNHRYTWKCRTTRASQTSTYVSNCDTSVSDPSLSGARAVYVMKDMRRLDKGHFFKYTGRRPDNNSMNISDV